MGVGRLASRSGDRRPHARLPSVTAGGWEGADGLVAKLVTELTNARRRGLDELDFAEGGQHRIKADPLERLQQSAGLDYHTKRIAVPA